MTISTKLGSSYESIRAASRIKTIKVAINDVECELKVRVPVKREMDEITARLATPNADLVKQLYEEMSKPLRDTVAGVEDGFLEALNADGEKMRFTDNDVIVNGTSVRNVATLTSLWQQQVELFFSLLQTQTGEPVNESYTEIADEFPEAVIREIVKRIDDAIRPSYQDAKKN
tara:strand:+ start:375 stop:893 length:519 start_codon:yes stop_codon:yes gene_type:complete